MMINFHTPSDELWNTIDEEYEKAKYWMIKQFGGEKRYEAMRDDLLRRSAYGQQSLISKMVYYTSREGNRWICFENATYYPESFASNAMPTCYCYYETAGSLGLFMPGFDTDSIMNCILIFTPHFFQRYAERMGIDGDMKEVLERFATSTRFFAVSPMPDDESGLERRAIRIANDCTGYGIRRSGDKNVFEVRTILTDAQLSKAQSARNEHVSNLREVMIYEPDEIVKRRVELSANPSKDYHDKMDQMHALGIDTTQQEDGTKISMTIARAFVKMGITTFYDMEFWERYKKASHDPIVFFLKRRDDEGENFNYFTELVSTGREIAARLGIRKFAWREFARILKP